MQPLAFLKQADHSRKMAIYSAKHDGKRRSFAYNEELGECRETFSRLVQDIQKGEIGAVMTADAACLSIETAPGWMELLIQLIKHHEVLIGDQGHDLVYDLRDTGDEAEFRKLYSQEEYEKERQAPRSLADAIAQSPFSAAFIEKGENWFMITRIEEKALETTIYSFSSGAKGKEVDMLGMGHWKTTLDALAPYGITDEEGWQPITSEQKEWLTRTQQQEDVMAEQVTATMKTDLASLPKDGRPGWVMLPGTGKIRSKKRRK